MLEYLSNWKGVYMKKEDKIYLDQKGYEQFLQEIDEIRKALQKNGKNKSSAFVGAVGDGWHDNFEFEEAKREELRLGKILQEKLEILSRIEIIDSIIEESEAINVDDYILAEMKYGDDLPEQMIFKLVGLSTPNFKADIPEISLNSPLGKAVYQKKVGDLVSYSVNGFVTSVLINKKSKKSENFEEDIKEKRI